MRSSSGRLFTTSGRPIIRDGQEKTIRQLNEKNSEVKEFFEGTAKK
jgi:hypothetical protein